MNNTAATAMFVPVAEGLSKRSGKSVSRFLMPVAFASMLGGCITLIGTSTNLAVSGYLEKIQLPPIGMFELAPVGQEEPEDTDGNDGEPPGQQG